MIVQELPLSVDYASAGLPIEGRPRLTAYVAEPVIGSVSPRPAVIICPGGAYLFTSDTEAEPIALRFVADGFQCFVLRYSCEPMGFPGALLELGKAMLMVRESADKWQIDPTKIFVMGFSAGAHLASSLGVFWNREFLYSSLNTSASQLRPRGVVAAYPVITSGEHCHRRSFEVLLNNAAPGVDRDLLSLEKQVTEHTPPFFLWHTADDENVSSFNSLLMAAALREHGVPFELHIFPHGRHGLSLATDQTGTANRRCAAWASLAVQWMKDPDPLLNPLNDKE